MIGSFIYSHASIYEAVMRALYGRGYNERFRPVAELIAEIGELAGSLAQALE